MLYRETSWQKEEEVVQGECSFCSLGEKLSLDGSKRALAMGF